MTTANTNNLIKIETSQEGVQAVSGRELHEFLKVRTPYNKWIARMIEYGFEEDQDFRTKMSESTGGRSATDHILNLDMAKEICMIQRSERGKQARLYFIECERQLQLVNTDSYAIADPLARAQRWIEEEQERRRLAQIAEEQAAELEAAQPAIEFADACSKGSGLTMQEVAKLLAIKGYGRTNIFRLLYQEHIFEAGKCDAPYQQYVDRGYFRVVVKGTKEIIHHDGSRNIITTKQVYVTPDKGVAYIRKLIQADIRRGIDEVEETNVIALPRPCLRLVPSTTTMRRSS